MVRWGVVGDDRPEAHDSGYASLDGPDPRCPEGREAAGESVEFLNQVTVEETLADTSYATIEDLGLSSQVPDILMAMVAHRSPRPV